MSHFCEVFFVKYGKMKLLETQRKYTMKEEGIYTVQYMKKKVIIAALLVVTLTGAGSLAYRGYALEKEVERAAGIHSVAVEEAKKLETIQNEKFVASWEERVYPGVTILGEDLSGLHREEVLAVLKDHVLTTMSSQSFRVEVEGKIHNISLAELEMSMDVESLADLALSIGKNLTTEEKLSRIYAVEEEYLETPFLYNEERVLAFIKTVAEEHNMPAKDATIQKSGETFTVTEHQTGMVVDEEALLQELKKTIEALEVEKPVQATLVLSEPKITADALRKIDGRLSSFTTNYSTSAEGRKWNVSLAASLINGTVVMPGETFSYNEEIGTISLSTGFRNAGIYIGDRIEEGLGGGICQVSSTLYQAVLHGNLGIVQRSNHSMAVSYMSPGMDAVVYAPYLDLKFKNNNPNPVYVFAYGDNNNLTVAMYGHKADLNGYSYKVYSETLNVIEPEVIEKEDPTMYVGERKDDNIPFRGYTSRTYRQTIKDGKVVNTEFLSQDTYKKVDKIVLVGTKPKPETVEPPVAPPVDQGEEGTEG